MHGRRRVFTLGVFAYLVTSVLCAFSTPARCSSLPGAPGHWRGRHVRTSSAILSSAYPPNERGRVLGITSRQSIPASLWAPLLAAF